MLKNLLKYFRQPLGVVAISFGLIPFMSPKQQPFVFNFDYTVNFFQAGEKWPYEKLFTPAEKQVYAQLGKPDCFRMLWDRTGKIKVRSVVEQEWKVKGPKEIPAYTWVYVQRNEEIVFSNNTFYTQPLTDLVTLVMKSGDPENVRDMGNGLTQWTYYSTGKMYTIAGDKIVGTKEFPAMGSFHK